MTRSENDVVNRVKDYFGRQIASLKGIRLWLEALCENPDSKEVEQLEAEHAEGIRETGALAAEFSSLEHAWRALEDLDPSEEKEVRDLASEAEALALEVRGLYEKASEFTRARAGGLSEALDEIGRGKDLLTKYGGQPRRDAWYLDRKA